MTQTDPAGAPVAPATPEKKPLPAYLMMGGGALLVLGSFLPWAKVEWTGLGSGLGDIAGIDTSATVSGMDGDGTITLVLGVALGVLGWLHFAKGWNKVILIAAMAVGGLAALTAVIDITDVSKFADTSDLLGDVGIEASVGIGLYICLVAALAGAAGGFLGFRDKPAD